MQMTLTRSLVVVVTPLGTVGGSVSAQSLPTKQVIQPPDFTPTPSPLSPANQTLTGRGYEAVGPFYTGGAASSRLITMRLAAKDRIAAEIAARPATNSGMLAPALAPSNAHITRNAMPKAKDNALESPNAADNRREFFILVPGTRVLATASEAIESGRDD